MKLRDREGRTLEQFLSAYDVTKYERPSVAVDMAVFTLLKGQAECDLAVLLIRRGNHPHLGEWALPGGFVNMDEELQDAAKRELREETGIDAAVLRPFGIFGGVHRDPRTRVISAGFYGVAPMGSIAAAAGDDASDAGLFALQVGLEATSAAAELYRITLLGPSALTARAKLRHGAMGKEPAHVPGGDLASDHSLVLFSALCALQAQPRERIARLLSGGRPKFKAAAEAALSRALCAIPRSL